MTAYTIVFGKKIPTSVISLFTSILLIFFLFYIDEGYYNFNWMSNFGNWIAFIIYLAVFSLGQIITFLFILKKYKGNYKTALTNLIGIPLGFISILLLFAGFSYL